jgi:hypothetical protein
VRRVQDGEYQMPEVVELLQDSREVVVAEAAAASSVVRTDTWQENVQRLVTVVKDVEATAALSAVKKVIWLVNAQKQAVIVVNAATIVAVSNAERMGTWLVNVQIPKTKTLAVVDVVAEAVDALATNATKKVTWPKNVLKQVETTITEVEDNLTSDQDVMTEMALKQMMMHGVTQKVTSKQMAGATATPKEIQSGDRFKAN